LRRQQATALRANHINPVGRGFISRRFVILYRYIFGDSKPLPCIQILYKPVVDYLSRTQESKSAERRDISLKKFKIPKKFFFLIIIHTRTRA
jgi:hypothetical protein